MLDDRLLGAGHYADRKLNWKSRTELAVLEAQQNAYLMVFDLSEHTAESWNVTHPIGTLVRYWPIYPPIESAPPIDTTTRSEAWELGDGSVVVCIVGKSGGVSLSHVEVTK
jgi:hypothetical protein